MNRFLALVGAIWLAFAPVALAGDFTTPGSRPRPGNQVIQLGHGAAGQVPVYVGPNSVTPGPSPFMPNTQSGTTYTVVASDQGKFIRFTNTSNVAVTLPNPATVGSGWWTILNAHDATYLVLTPASGNIDGLSAYSVLNGGAVIVVTDGANYDVVPFIGFNASPNSSIGYSFQRATASTVGGNSRGSGAVDLQLDRNAASQVANGNYSFAAGHQNTSSGLESFTGGRGNTASSNGDTAFGYNNSVTGSESFAAGESNTVGGSDAAALGANNTANGAGSISLGSAATDRSNPHTFAFNGGGLSSTASFPGRNQWEEHIFWANYSGSSSVQLTADGSSAGAHNLANLSASMAAVFDVDVLAVDKTTGASVNTWTLRGACMNRSSGGNVTMCTSNPTFTAGPTVGSSTFQAAPAISADTTNQGLTLTLQPPTGNTDNWYLQAKVRMLVTQYN